MGSKQAGGVHTASPRKFPLRLILDSETEMKSSQYSGMLLGLPYSSADLSLLQQSVHRTTQST